MTSCVSKSWSCGSCLSSSCWWGETPQGNVSCHPSRDLFGRGDWTILLSPGNERLCPPDGEVEDNSLPWEEGGIALGCVVTVGVLASLCWTQRRRICDLFGNLRDRFRLFMRGRDLRGSYATVSLSSPRNLTSPEATAPLPPMSPTNPFIPIPLAEEEIVLDPKSRDKDAHGLLNKMRTLLERAKRTGGMDGKEETELKSINTTTPLVGTSHGGRTAPPTARELFPDSDDEEETLFLSPKVNPFSRLIEVGKTEEKAGNQGGVVEENEEEEQSQVEEEIKQPEEEDLPPVIHRSEEIAENREMVEVNKEEKEDTKEHEEEDPPLVVPRRSMRKSKKLENEEFHYY